MVKVARISLFLLFLSIFSFADIDDALNLYEEGKYQKAYPLLKKYCDVQNPKACNYLGIMYYYGRGVAQDFDASIRALELSCNKDEPRACYNLAKLSNEQNALRVDTNTIVQLFSKASQLYQRECNTKDDDVACFGLGHMYYRGDGLTHNAQKAYTYYKKSCENGNAMGCFNVGAMKESGDGTYINKKEAIKLYANACDANYARACHVLGVRHYNGDGVKEDINKAKSFFKKGCSLGYEKSCTSYSNLR